MSENHPHPAALPRTLVAGQRLDQPTFHALYESMPPGSRAELIGGVVFMPGPVGRAHGRAQVPGIVWLDYYAENTPGVEVLDNATAILGWKSEPQPDVMLRVLPECGGRTADQKGFVRGAPELVVEVSRASYDQDAVRGGTHRMHATKIMGPCDLVSFSRKRGILPASPSVDDGAIGELLESPPRQRKEIP